MGFHVPSRMWDWRYKRSTPPSSLKRFTFKNDLNLKIHFVRAVKIPCWMGWRLRTRSTIAKQDRRTQTQRKIVLQVEATIRGRLATCFIDSSKGWAHCSEGHLIVSVSCLGSAVLRATPSLSAKLCHKEHVASIWGMMRSWTNCCFSSKCFKRKAKDVKVTPRTRKHMDLSYIDSLSKVLNYCLKLYTRPSLSSQP